MTDKKNDKKPTDPSKYFLGIFYFNKEDKRLLPPKRIAALGWTINFANPWSILLVLAIIGLMILIGETVLKDL